MSYAAALSRECGAGWSHVHAGGRRHAGAAMPGPECIRARRAIFWCARPHRPIPGHACASPTAAIFPSLRYPRDEEEVLARRRSALMAFPSWGRAIAILIGDGEHFSTPPPWEAEECQLPRVTAGDRLYAHRRPGGRFPAVGFHIPGEMGGIWQHPIKNWTGFASH